VTVYFGLKIFYQKNPVYSIFYFIFTIFNISCFLICCNVDFFAMLLILVYVGAIMILFLFIVMLLNIKIYEKDVYFFKYAPATFIFLWVLLTLFGAATLNPIYIREPMLIDYLNGFTYIN